MFNSVEASRGASGARAFLSWWLALATLAAFPVRADVIWSGGVSHDVAAPGGCSPTIDCLLPAGNPLYVGTGPGGPAIPGSVEVNAATGVGSVLTVPNGAFVGVNGQRGDLLVTGAGPGTPSSLLFTDPGAGSFAVGFAAGDQGFVRLENGALLRARNFTTIGGGDGGIGDVRLVNGATMTGDALMVGVQGQGTLALSGGALGGSRVDATFLGIGGNIPTATGTVQVTGGSRLNVTNGGSPLIGLGQGGAKGVLQIEGAGSSVNFDTRGFLVLGNSGPNGLGGEGTITVGSGAALNLTNQTSLVVGGPGTGAKGDLTVQGGGTLAISSVVPGAVLAVGGGPGGASGQVLVTGAGSTATVTTGTVNVGAGGSMTVTGGAEAYVGGKPVALPITSPWAPPGTAVVGVGTGGPGTLELGNGGALQAGALLVGGRGTLDIRNGGTATVNAFEAGSPSDSPGVAKVVISGAGSRLSAPGVVDIAGYFGGAADVRVSGGARMETQSLTVGNSGSLALSGTGTTLAMSGPGSVTVTAASGPGGIGGDASLTATGGAQISGAGAITLGVGVPSGGSTGNANATISGTGTSVQAFGLFVGSTAAATASISNGATLRAHNLQIGHQVHGNGTLTVGGGSEVTLASDSTVVGNRANLQVGREGTGRLDVAAGGRVLVDAAAVGTTVIGINIGGTGGSPPPAGVVGSHGAVNVDGAGSEIRVRSPYHITTVGRQGSGTLNVTNGGQFIHEDGATTASVVGRTFTQVGSEIVKGVGKVLVSGGTSLWEAGKRLFIGTDVNVNPASPDFLTASGNGGEGTVTVASGGTVKVSEYVYVGAGGTLTGGGGTIIGNIENHGNIAPGSSPGVMNVESNVNLAPDGVVTIELGGTNIALAQYDQLNAFDRPDTPSPEGTISLDGLVKVLLFGGFNPHAGDFFHIFTALDIQPHTLDPNHLELPALSAGLSWTWGEVNLDNGREAFRLAVVGQAAPEPGALLLMALGLAALAYVLQRHRAR